MLIQTTQDVLFIILSVSIVVLTGMLAYVLYYIGVTVKNTAYITDEVSEKVSQVSQMIDMVQDRFMGIATILADVIDGVKRFSDRRGKK